MTEKTAAEKMRIKPGATVALLNAPDGFEALLGLPQDTKVVAEPAGAACVILLVTSQAEFDERFSAVLPHITHDTNFWVVYPKGSKAAGLDISRDTIWPVADGLGMRPVGMVSVDGTWSGFRLRTAE